MARLDSIAAWQRTLLPLMVVMLVAAAVFFAWQSVVEFRDFKTRIEPARSALPRVLEQIDPAMGTSADAERMQYARWRMLVLLEQEALAHRYAQVNATILARVWTRLMGFTTGMVLAIVGAAFILGKLHEAQTELRQETELIKLSLVTSSPGVVLAVLGSLLMSITLLTRFDIDVRDAAIYINAFAPMRDDPRSLLTSPPSTSAPPTQPSSQPSEPPRPKTAPQ